jgi:hypothetical protein
VPDLKLRQLQRRAESSGSPEDYSRYYKEAYRLGFIRRWQIEAATYLDYPPVKGWIVDRTECNHKFRGLDCRQGYHFYNFCDLLDRESKQTKRVLPSWTSYTLARVWDGDLDDLCHAHNSGEPYNLRAERFKTEVMLTSLEILADRLHYWGWSDERYLAFKKEVRYLPESDFEEQEHIWQRIDDCLNEEFAWPQLRNRLGHTFRATFHALHDQGYYENAGFTLGHAISWCLDAPDVYKELEYFCKELSLRLGSWLMEPR